MKLIVPIPLKSIICALVFASLHAMEHSVGAGDTSHLNDILFGLIETNASVEDVREIIKQGVDINARMKLEAGTIEQIYRPLVQSLGLTENVTFTSSATRAGYTPLSWALKHNRCDLIEPFLEAGANPNDYYCNWNYDVTYEVTPLNLAAQAGLTELVRLLLRAGADPNAKHSIPSPLYAAVDGDHIQVVKLLLEAGANPYIEYECHTPLSLAAQKQNSTIVITLMPYMLLQPAVQTLMQGRNPSACQKRLFATLLTLRRMLGNNAQDLIPHILCSNTVLKSDLLCALHIGYSKGRTIREPYFAILKTGMNEYANEEKNMNYLNIRLSPRIREYLTNLFEKKERVIFPCDLLYTNKENVVVENGPAKKAAQTKASIKKKQTIFKTVLFTAVAAAVMITASYILHQRKDARRKMNSI